MSKTIFEEMGRRKFRLSVRRKALGVTVCVCFCVRVSVCMCVCVVLYLSYVHV